MGRRGLRCIGRRRDMYEVMLDCCSVVRFREVAAAGMAMGQLVMTRNRGCFGFTPCWYVILILSENLARPLRATTLRPSSHHTDTQNTDVISTFPRPIVSFLILPFRTPPSKPPFRFRLKPHPPLFRTPTSNTLPLSQPPPLTPHQPQSQRSLHNPSPD